MIHALEPRVLLSAALHHGLLQIDGGNANDRIILSLLGRWVTLPRGQRFRANRIEQITVNGGAGNDRIILKNLRIPASLVGGSGNDTLVGGGGNDTLDGGSGDDVLSGMGGNDSISGGAGHNSLDGGTGVDTVSYSASKGPISMTPGKASATVVGPNGAFDLLRASIEDIVGSMFDDVLCGTGALNRIFGLEGDDTLRSGGHGDTLDGGAGDDLLQPLSYQAVLRGGDGVDTADFSSRTADLTITLDNHANDGEADEQSNVASDVEHILGGAGNDTIVGGAAGETLDGGAGNDSLVGGGGANLLAGQAGDDWLVSDSGSDTLAGGEGHDTADYSGRSTDLRLSMDDVADDGAAGQTGDIHTDVENLIGGQGNDRLVGSKYRNVIWGGAGDDTIDGGSGWDHEWGASGKDNDTLWGGDGFDIADYSARSYLQQLRIAEGTGIPGEQDIPEHDIEGFWGGSGPDWIEGDEHDNLLVGNGGDDTIIGRLGNDTLIGGAGADVMGHDMDPGAPNRANEIKIGGDDTYYTNTPDVFDDGQIDVINDDIGNNVFHLSEADGDYTRPHIPSDA